MPIRLAHDATRLRRLSLRSYKSRQLGSLHIEACRRPASKSSVSCTDQAIGKIGGRILPNEKSLLDGRFILESNGVEQRIHEICDKAGIDYQYLQVPSYEVGYTIAEQAATFGVERLIIGAEKRNRLENVLKGSVMRSLSGLLPEDVQLVIFGG